MAIDVINIEIIETTENFVDHIRPPEEMRGKLDINYRIENQSVILFEIRPSWTDNSEILHHDFAKTTYDRKKCSLENFLVKSQYEVGFV